MTTPKKLLILGGTGDGTELVQRAAEIPGIEVINSLAGRTRQPIVSYQHTRIGGFGGVEGLTDYLRQEQIDLMIDATHPFAGQISGNASAAADRVGIPHLMLIRPVWEPVAGDRWIEVESNAAAAAILPGLATRIFLTIGRQELAAFAHLQHLWFLMRSIDPPPVGTPLPPGEMLLERGPFTLAAERSRLQEYRIDTIVSKNSGGDATYAKIIAARELGITVVMVQRPPIPGGERVHTIEEAIAWIVSSVDVGGWSV
jgi:precorrin-6A/cobalt-precorrin-6A reductase